jgi:predicted nucleotidyltransferase component of viral defense system
MAPSRNDHSFPHVDAPLFKETILYTAGETGFNAQLVEKDYFCSLILEYLFVENETPLVFKGGTCLSKVHTDFYRLSEDLDFVIPISPDASRTERREEIEPLKKKINKLKGSIPEVSIQQGLTGHNVSTQYISYINYHSVVGATEVPSSIKIEIGMREELLEPAIIVSAKTLIINPFTGEMAYMPIEVNAMSFIEAYAEKFRAALTRKEPAIRDFYDIYFAISNKYLKFDDQQLLTFIDKKLQVPGNENLDTSLSRKDALEKQLDTQLKPVLRKSDFDDFNLNEAFEIVVQIAQKIH